MILQIAMFASAIAFGVKSIDIAKIANEYSASANSFSACALEEARVANQLSMLAVCLQAGDVKIMCFAFIYLCQLSINNKKNLIYFFFVLGATI